MFAIRLISAIPFIVAVAQAWIVQTDSLLPACWDTPQAACQNCDAAARAASLGYFVTLENTCHVDYNHLTPENLQGTRYKYQSLQGSTYLENTCSESTCTSCSTKNSINVPNDACDKEWKSMVVNPNSSDVRCVCIMPVFKF